jgi:hypothetical protein
MCPECKDKGVIQLLTSSVKCSACGGANLERLGGGNYIGKIVGPDPENPLPKGVVKIKLGGEVSGEYKKLPPYEMPLDVGCRADIDVFHLLVWGKTSTEVAAMTLNCLSASRCQDLLLRITQKFPRAWAEKLFQLDPVGIFPGYYKFSFSVGTIPLVAAFLPNSLLKYVERTLERFLTTSLRRDYGPWMAGD